MFKKIQPNAEGNFPCGVWANVSWNMLKQGRCYWQISTIWYLSLLLTHLHHHHDHLFPITSSLILTKSWPTKIKMNGVKDTRSSRFQSPLSKKQTKLHGFPLLFNHIFLLMSGKYVCVANEKYVLDQWEAFSHSCMVIISLNFLLQNSEFYWTFGLVFDI